MTLELRLCYRKSFDAIVNLCKFPQPIGLILKSCWGDPSSLDVALAILSRNINHVYPSVDWASYRRRATSVFKLLSAEVAPYKAQTNVCKLLLLESAAQTQSISPQSVNKFRRLISLAINVNMGARMFRGVPAFRPFLRIINRVSNAFPSGRNLSIKFSHLPSALFDPNASSVHQLISPLASISGLSYASGVFDNPTASAFSTFTYGS
ncbi:MAG: hypothetical protein ACTS44_00530 [Candidatus Hodgkinia cicadicola]